MDASSLIDEHGGPAAFAAKVQKTPGSVRVWKHRNQIPREAWPEVIQAIPGITLDLLMSMEVPAPPASDLREAV